MANAGPDPSLPNYNQDVNTDDTQFFITTTGSRHFLDYGSTIFGQLVSGASSLAKMTQVPVQYSSVYRADVAPLNPLVMSSVTMSATNPNGVVLIDTTQAKPGETATFLVTATDPQGGRPVSQSFTVTVGPYSESNDPSPTDPAIDFKPYNGGPATPTTQYNTATTITLPAGTSGYPDSTAPTSLSYALASQPSHGTISNFNPTTGTFTYTPKPGFVGTDTFQYEVQETGPTPPIGADVTFRGAVNAAEADDTAIYRLATAGKKGSFTAKNAKVIKLKSAVYDSSDNTVTLIPRKPFALTKPVQLVVDGLPPSGLRDISSWLDIREFPGASRGAFPPGVKKSSRCSLGRCSATLRRIATPWWPRPPWNCSTMARHSRWRRGDFKNSGTFWRRGCDRFVEAGDHSPRIAARADGDWR